MSGGTEKAEEVDFEVIREPWNKYELNDGTILKFRLVLLKAIKRRAPDGKINYGFDYRTLLAVLHVPPHLRGPPTNRVYSPEELQANIVADDIPYSTLYEEWGEYNLDDGTTVRIKSTVTRVSRTSLYDKEGNPIYYVLSSHISEVKARRKEETTTS